MQRSGASSGSAQAIAVNTAGAHEDDADFLAFHVEHIVAKQHGGSDDPETLCYACSECNWAKGPNLSGMLNDKLYPLFNPRKQNWTRHFYWDHTILVGKTNMPRHVWLSMPERRFIFWSEHYSPAMIQLASRENARVAVCELKPLAGVDPLHILLHVHQQAMPWIEAMDEAVCFLPPTERSLLLAGLELTPTAWCAFRDGCSRRAREILLRCPEHAHIIEAAHTEGGDVVERPDGWYARATGEQISDAIIRFQRILVPTKGPTLVQGQLSFRGEELRDRSPAASALDVSHDRCPFQSGAWRPHTALGTTPNILPPSRRNRPPLTDWTSNLPSFIDQPLLLHYIAYPKRDRSFSSSVVSRK